MGDGIGARVAGYRCTYSGAATNISASPLAIPWTNTDHEDADWFSQSGNTLTVLKACHVLLWYWARIQAAGVGRRLVMGNVSVGGVMQGPGLASAYIAGTGNATTAGMMGRGVFSFAAGDQIQIQLRRIDTSGASAPQLLAAPPYGRVGVALVRLDKADWYYGRYSQVGFNPASAGLWKNVYYAAIDEEDSTAFALDSPLNMYRVKCKLTGHHMLTATMRCRAATAERANVRFRVLWDGGEIFTQVSDTIRRRDGCNDVMVSLSGIFNATSANKYVQIQYQDEGGSFQVGQYATLELVKLPDTADYLMMRETGAADRADQDADRIPWGIEDEKDAGSFSHSTSVDPENIGFTQDGRFAFFGQAASERGGTDQDRLLHRLMWRKVQTGVELVRGASMSFDRGYDPAAPALNSLYSGSHAILLAAAGTTADIIALEHNQDAGGNVDANCLFSARAIQIVNLNTLMPLGLSARGGIEAHGRAPVSSISGITIEGRGLVEAQAAAALGVTRHAGAQAGVEALATPVIPSGISQIKAKRMRVTAQAHAPIGRISSRSAHALASAHAEAVPMSVLRGAGAHGGVRALASPPLSVVRGLSARGLGSLQARTPLSVGLGFGIDARGLVTAEGLATLSTIRAALAFGLVEAQGSPSPLSPTRGLEAEGSVEASADAPLSVVRRSSALGIVSLHAGGALGLIERIKAHARGLVAIQAHAPLSVIRGLEASGVIGAETLESALAVLRAIEAKGLIEAQGIAPASLQSALAIHARGLVTCSALASLGATRGVGARGEASINTAEGAISVLRLLSARALARSSGAVGALSTLRGLSGRGLFSTLARANPNRVFRFHARGLVQAVILQAEVGDRPKLGFYAQTARDIRVRVREQWGTPQSISVGYDNFPFTQPANTLHAEASVVFGSGVTEFAEVGRSDYLSAEGELEVVIRAPTASGEETALEAADALASEFRSVIVGTIHFGEPRVEKRGISGAFFEVVVHAPFWAEDARTRLAPVGPIHDGDRDSVGGTLRQRLRVEVATPEAVATQYENLPFERTAGEEWLRAAVVEGGTWQAEKAGESEGTHRAAGVFFVDISVPFGTGESRLLELVDAIDDAFRAVSVHGVELLEPTVNRGHRVGADWRRTVAVPYSADIIS